jgi:hypothetical protein
MAQDALEFTSLPAAAPRLQYLAGLDMQQPGFPRMAAQRIALLSCAPAIDAALAEVPRQWLQFVETLTVAGLAKRIAQEVETGARERVLAIVPDSLLGRVQPLAKSYASALPRKETP